MEQLMSNVLQILRYDEKQYESDFIQFLREEIIKWSCLVGDKECRKKAEEEMMTDLSKKDTL